MPNVADVALTAARRRSTSTSGPVWSLLLTKTKRTSFQHWLHHKVRETLNRNQLLTGCHVLEIQLLVQAQIHITYKNNIVWTCWITLQASVRISESPSSSTVLLRKAGEEVWCKAVLSTELTKWLPCTDQCRCLVTSRARVTTGAQASAKATVNDKLSQEVSKLQTGP